MKAALLLGAVFAAGVSYYYLSPSPPSPSMPTPAPVAPPPAASQSKSLVVESNLSGQRFTAKVEDNHVEYRVTGEFVDNFRVFGVSPNESSNSPTSHVSAFVKLARLEDSRAALAKDGCERIAASSAKTVAVVVDDEDVASQLEDFVPHGGELKLSGMILEIESHRFAGREFKFASSDVSVEKIYLLRGVGKATPSPVLSKPPLSSTPLIPAAPHDAAAVYSWNFTAPESSEPKKKVATRPTCKKKRIVRVIRRCPR